MPARVLVALALLPLLAGPLRAADPGLDAWGGWTGLATSATGRFRVERIDGVWWLVTPDGHGFFSSGVDHLTPDGDFSPPLGTSPYRDNALARWGSEAGWATATRERLRDFGFNTIGAFSRPDLFPGTIAYTVTMRLSRSAPLVPGMPPSLVAREIRDYWDGAFLAGVPAEAATQAAPCAADPWCLGVFTDNEIALGQSLGQSVPYLDAYLSLPAGAPGKVAAQAFLAGRYAGPAAFNAVWGTALASWDDVQTLTALTPAPATLPASPTGSAAQIADRRAFDAHVAAHFHRVTHDAVRAAAPGVLILGSRLLVLSTRPEVLAAIAPWVDVLTVNYYAIAPSILALFPSYPEEYGIPFTRMWDDVDAMYRIAGKPILIGEFGYRAADAGLPNTVPPFFPTLPTQAARAHEAGTYVRRALARPFVVGTHWFQYMDQPATGRFDGENQNFGLVNVTDDPWVTVTDRFRAVHGDAAARRVLAPGEPSAADCLLEWASTAPLAPARRTPPVPKTRFTCVDGDPSCDTDDVAGQCTIEVQPCAGVADGRLAACGASAPTAARVVQPKADREPDLHAALAGSLAAVLAPAGAAPGSCGPAVPVVLSLGKRSRVHRTLRVVGTGGGSDDREAVRVLCERAGG